MVPPGFAQDLHGQVLGTAIISLDGLRLPVWEVRLIRHDGNLYFQKGWNEFFRLILPPLYDWMLLTFKYEGNLTFTVSRYSYSGDLIYDLPLCQIPTGVPYGLSGIDPSFSLEVPPNAKEARAQVTTSYPYLTTLT